MSPKPVERLRNEAYLPRPEFRAWLEMGLGRVAFMAKHWDQAIQHYERVIRDHAETTWVPEALYWRAVCIYQSTHDHSALKALSKDMARWPGSVWAVRASVYSSE